MKGVLVGSKFTKRYFIYDDPLRHYSYYRKLTSGSLMIKKNGEHFKISANIILPDGKIASTTL